MSYDIDFIFVTASDDPASEARSILLNDVERSPYEEEQIRRLKVIKELLRLHQSLKVENGKRGFEYGCYISSDDKNCDVLPIDFDVDRAFTSFSYSSNPERAFRSLQRIIDIFVRHGYLTYNPQLDRFITSVLENEDSLKQFKSTFNNVVNRIEEMNETLIPNNATSRQQRPWWKLW